MRNVMPGWGECAGAGRADVPVGTANEKANEQAVNDTSLSPHSHANEDVGAPGGNHRFRPSGVPGGEENLHAVVEVFVEAAFDGFVGGAFVDFGDADELFLQLHFLGEGFFHFDE